MKCQRCNRPILTKPAATVKTKAGSAVFGPKCAKLMGLIEIATRHKKPEKTSENDDQMELGL